MGLGLGLRALRFTAVEFECFKIQGLGATRSEVIETSPGVRTEGLRRLRTVVLDTLRASEITLGLLRLDKPCLRASGSPGSWDVGLKLTSVQD